MINEQHIEEALHNLMETAAEYAAAKADMQKADHMRSVIKSLAMKAAERDGIKSVTAQEREAYASEQYIKHLDVLWQATVDCETLKGKRMGWQLQIELWRTEQANQRQGL